MKKLLLTWLLCSVLANGATAQTNLNGAQTIVNGGTGGSTASAAQINLGAALHSALAPGSLALVSGGTGYVLGDTITLTCASCTFTTSPVAVVAAVSGSIITTATIVNPGVATGFPTVAAPSLTQASTSGVGTGASFTGSFGPIAAALSIPSLNTGGGAANGNFFLTTESPGNFGGSPSIPPYGAENTFVGDRAGGGFTGAATANTAVGHNACGISGLSIPTGSFNTCIGDDAGRNISGTANNNTAVGQSALRVVSGGGNTAVGQGVMATATGNNNTVVGAFAAATMVNSAANVIIGLNAGNKITTGANGNVIIGENVATTTLVSGSNNVLIGTNSSIDTAAAGTSNTIAIGAGGTPVLLVTGAGTPTTSVPTLHGLPVLPDVTTGTPAASLCLDASNNIIKKTTSGACI